MADLTAIARQQQLQLRAVTLRQLLALWPIWRVDDDQSFDAFVAAVIPVLRLRHRDSAGVAARYYRAQRMAQGVPGEPEVKIPTFNSDRAVTSLYVTGQVYTGKAIRAGMKAEAAKNTALVRVSGAASRLVLNGGRETLANVTDRYRKGWARATSGSPCDWCSDMASAAESGDYAAAFASHDHCGCSPQPVF